MCLTADPGALVSMLACSHTFVEIGLLMKEILRSISSLRLIQEDLVSVTSKRNVQEVLVNGLFKLNLYKKFGEVN